MKNVLKSVITLFFLPLFLVFSCTKNAVNEPLDKPDGLVKARSLELNQHQIGLLDDFLLAFIDFSNSVHQSYVQGDLILENVKKISNSPEQLEHISLDAGSSLLGFNLRPHLSTVSSLSSKIDFLSFFSTQEKKLLFEERITYLIQEGFITSDVVHLVNDLYDYGDDGFLMPRAHCGWWAIGQLAVAAASLATGCVGGVLVGCVGGGIVAAVVVANTVSELNQNGSTGDCG